MLAGLEAPASRAEARAGRQARAGRAPCACRRHHLDCARAEPAADARTRCSRRCEARRAPASALRSPATAWGFGARPRGGAPAAAPASAVGAPPPDARSPSSRGREADTSGARCERAEAGRSPVAAPPKPIAPPVAAAPKPVAPAPAAARVEAPKPTRDAALDDERMRAIYDRYVDARRRNNERVDNVKFESVASSIEKMMPGLAEKHRGKNIDFEVVVKDGRVGLKPVAK